MSLEVEVQCVGMVAMALLSCATADVTMVQSSAISVLSDSILAAKLVGIVMAGVVVGWQEWFVDVAVIVLAGESVEQSKL